MSPWCHRFSHCLLVVPSTLCPQPTNKSNLTCYFVQVGTGIDHYLQSRGRRRRQPYLLCLGTRDSPAQLFVILDEDAPVPWTGSLRIQPRIPSPLFAFYVFLERCVFGIDATSKVPACVREMDSIVRAQFHLEMMQCWHRGGGGAICIVQATDLGGDVFCKEFRTDYYLI